jgi:four helix bundle protein
VKTRNKLPIYFKIQFIYVFLYLNELLFDHEKLDVYPVELGFVAWLGEFMDETSHSPIQHRRELIEQLDRAGLSVLLNTAEGNGKRQGRRRAKFFDDARGSAFECAACLDGSVAKRFASGDRVRPGKERLARIVSMVARLIDRFDEQIPRIRRKDSVQIP